MSLDVAVQIIYPSTAHSTDNLLMFTIWTAADMSEREVNQRMRYFIENCSLLSSHIENSLVFKFKACSVVRGINIQAWCTPQCKEVEVFQIQYFIFSV